MKHLYIETSVANEKPLATSKISTNTEQSGFTLIEILVTVLILAVGSLGIASLQLAGLKYTSGSYARTQAVLLADDMANRIKSNRTLALDLQADGRIGAASPYSIALGAAAPGATDCLLARCSSEDLADYDLDSWLTEVSRVLPAGQGEVTINDTQNPVTRVTERQFNIRVSWRQVANSTNSTGDPDAEIQDFTFRISI